MDKKWKYGTILFVKDGRNKPWLARLNIGYNINGYPITEVIGSFEDELDCVLCLREYTNSPYDLYIDKKKYDKIVKFINLPSKIYIKTSTKPTYIDKASYTFEQVYNEYSKYYFPTKEEIEIERKTHQKAKGKFSSDTMYVRKAAFKTSLPLHKVPYKDLRTLDFQKIIDTTNGATKKLERLRYLYMELDDFAEQKDIIEKGYAKYIKIENTNYSKIEKVPFSDNEIQILWKERIKEKKTHLRNNSEEKEKIVRDILLILLYSGMRIEELLFLFTSNVYLDEGYFIGGLKTESGKNRIIPIHHLIKPIFEEYYNKENNFFITYNKEKLQYSVYRIWLNEYMKRLNFKHTSHDARHSVVTELDHKNANLKCRNLILGHKCKDTGNEVYNKKNLQDLIDTIELITYNKTSKKNMKLINNVLIYDDFTKKA